VAPPPLTLAIEQKRHSYFEGMSPSRHDALLARRQAANTAMLKIDAEEAEADSDNADDKSDDDGDDSAPSAPAALNVSAAAAAASADKAAADENYDDGEEPESDEYTLSGASRTRQFEYRLVCVADLAAHACAVTALHMSSDANSLWSGDEAGNVLLWNVNNELIAEPLSAAPLSAMSPPPASPLLSPQSASTPSSSPNSPVSGERVFSDTESRGGGACTCHQSKSGKQRLPFLSIPPRRMCSMCKRYICDYCRLEHMRKEHPFSCYGIASAPHGHRSSHS
jgi:hypothetical protein